MIDSHQKFWPYRPRKSILATVLTFIILMAAFVILKTTLDWSGEKSETLVLIGILLLSIFPIALSLVDVLVEKGGSVEYKGLKIDFAQTATGGGGTSGFKVPDNIGVPGQAVTDSSTTEILDTLREATTSDTIVIDLKEGQAWWETRLLVLLTGAVRHGKPEKVVFIGTDRNVEQVFQGWAYPAKLLPLLLASDRMYAMIYHKALAAAQQWALVEPIGKEMQPANLPFMQVTATKHTWMAFDYQTGLPNKLYSEQLLASVIGEEIENQGSPRTISLTRLEELFRSVLRNESIDESWETKKQMDAFFDSRDEYLVITQKGKYQRLVSKVSLLNEAVKSMMKQ